MLRGDGAGRAKKYQLYAAVLDFVAHCSSSQRTLFEHNK